MKRWINARPSALWRVLSLSRQAWRGMALASFLGLLTILSSLSLMASSAWLISKAALQPSIAELSVAVVGVRFFGIARGVSRYLERVVSHELTFRLLAYLRVSFYRALEPLAPARLHAWRTGDLLSRAIDDIEGLQNLFLRGLAPPLVALGSALAVCLFLGMFHLGLAVVALAFMLLAGLGVPLWVWWNNQHTGQTRIDQRAQLNARLLDSIQGLPEALVYGQSQQLYQHVQDLNHALAQSERRSAHTDALQVAFSAFLTHASAVAILWVAIPRIEGIYLATVTLATLAVFEAFLPLSQAALHLSANIQAAERLYELADQAPPVSDASAPIHTAIAPESAVLRIEHLHFRYTPDEPVVLQDVNLRLEAGQRIAILGESGAGKSTLVNLLLRFWDCPEGTIYLGEQDIRAYRLSALRDSLGVMSQRTYVFNTSIRENIQIANVGASFEAVQDAARRAHIHDFILSLPQAYETPVGENGVRLSGGERQRLALARVLLKNAPLLILDEATANLDPLTERAVLQTILDSTQEHGVLMFTHRTTCLEQMDAVYRLEGGCLERYKLG